MQMFMGKSAFVQKLAVFHGHAKTTGPMLQELILDGLRYAAHPSLGGDGNLRRLTLVLHACQMVKSVPTRTIQRYIQQYVDAKWCKLSDDSMGFKFQNGAGSTLPDVAWYDWEGNTEKSAKEDPDLVKMLQSIQQRVTAATKKGTNVQHAELLPEIAKLIAKATAQVHNDKPAVALVPVAVDDWSETV